MAEPLRQLEDFMAGGQEAPIQRGPLRRPGDAVSAFAPGPQELLGLSPGPAFMDGTLGSSALESENDNLNEQLRLLGRNSRVPRFSQWNSSVSNRHENSANPIQRYERQDPQDEFWSPARSTGARLHHSGPELTILPQSGNYRTARSLSTAESHARTVDSGYYSASQPDLNSPYSAGIARLSADLASSPLAGAYPSTPGPGSSQQVEQPTMVGPSEIMRQPVSSLQCDRPDCEFVAKTKSDLNKHNARHERRHKCEVEGCPNIKGFANINDLERHQKSKHRIEPMHGQSKYWKCMAPGCKSSSKEWARSDNFRQHYKKQHPDENPDELLRLSDQWYEESRGNHAPSQPDASAVYQTSTPAGTLAPEQYLTPNWQSHNSNATFAVPRTPRARHGSLGQPDLANAYSPRPPVNMMAQNAQESFIDDDAFSDSHQTRSARAHDGHFAVPISWSYRPSHAQTVPDPDLPRMIDLPDINAHPISAVTDEAALSHIGSALPGPSLSDQDMSLSGSPHRATPQLSPELLTALKSMIGSQSQTVGSGNKFTLKQIWDAGVKSLNGSNPVSSTSSSASTRRSAPTARSTSRESHPCLYTSCTYTSLKKSDLTKHLKRHRRPYCCTHPGCFDRFGSKYDWTRHEQNLHVQRECWRCNVKPNVGGTPNCARVFWKEDKFEEHLVNDHFRSRDLHNAEYIRQQRIGHKYEDRFWCGFCNAVLPLQNKAEKGVKERNDHIHLHFNAGLNISDWIEIDGGAKKGKPPSAHPHDDSPEPDDLGTQAAAGRCQKRGRSSSQSHASQPAKQRRCGSPSVTYWYCHICNGEPMSIQSYPRCPDCRHDFCKECRIS